MHSTLNGLGTVRCSPDDVAEELPLPVLARVQREAGTPFNLASGPLVRALLIRLCADDHLLLLTVHHTIADGWSIKVTPGSQLSAQSVTEQSHRELYGAEVNNILGVLYMLRL